MITDADEWRSYNRQVLTDHLLHLRRGLEEHAGPAIDGRRAAIAPLGFAEGDQSTLAHLCHAFELSGFEQQLLLLCAGYELDANFEYLFGVYHKDAAHNFPTMALAFTLLMDADWSVLSAARPLRFWNLVRVAEDVPLIRARLTIAPEILQYLVDGVFWDPELADTIQPLPENDIAVASHRDLPGSIVSILDAPALPQDRPAIQLIGQSGPELRAIITAVSDEMGLQPFVISLQNVPAKSTDLDALLRRWDRMAELLGGVLVVDAYAADLGAGPDPAQEAAAGQLIDRVSAPVILMGIERRKSQNRTMSTLQVAPPTRNEQLGFWTQAVGAFQTSDPAAQTEVDAAAAALSSNFNIAKSTMDAIVLGANAAPDTTVADYTDTLWQGALALNRPRLESLATRMPAKVGWDALELRSTQLSQLKMIVAQIRNAHTVNEDWGMGPRDSRGLGVAALFAGPSGTGKTLSAEVIANTLNYDLFRVDLSVIVDKYIGETEKNLRRIFDAAEAGGVVLLFDEADALFGKRSKVKDSHDRHANIEVSYLLQRIETFAGLAILTTNLKSSLDQAFMRRLRFVVDFPFPGPDARRRMWDNAFPAAAPTSNLDVARLAQFEMAGGQIRTAALNAAFLAAEAREPISMDVVFQAIRTEYMKVGKILTQAEIEATVG